MATFRGQGASSYSVGLTPPDVLWTVVRGDTASFRVYVTEIMSKLDVEYFNQMLDEMQAELDTEKTVNS